LQDESKIGGGSQPTFIKRPMSPLGSDNLPPMGVQFCLHNGS
jgi:hypothetical protein